MISAALVACILIAVNCAYAVAGLLAAAHYGIGMSLTRGAGLAILLLGSAAEYAALFGVHDGAAQLTALVAFGAVVVGSACDAASGYVFDAITLPSLAVSLSLSIAFGTLASFALGVLGAGGTLAVLYAITRGRGLGLGDVKLACCIGAVTGVLGAMEAIGIAFVIGGIYAAFLLVTKRARRGTELRFAPYLAAGMTVVMLRAAAL